MSNPSVAIEKQREWHRRYLTYGRNLIDQETLEQARHDQIKLRQVPHSSYAELSPDDKVFSILTDNVLTTGLEIATPFYWSPEICDLMREVSTTIPEYTLRAEAIPAEHGFFYFDKPILLSNEHLIQGFVWRWFDVQINKETLDKEMPDATEDDIAFVNNFNETHQQGQLVLVSIEIPPGGVVNAARFISSTIIWTVGNSSAVPKRFLFTSEPENQATNEIDLLASCFSFIEQRILVTQKEKLDRPARRRLEREHVKVDDVTTIVLRRKQYIRADDKDDKERTDVEWSCRWIVRGHWKRQWYPATQVHKPIWIMPVIKGPQDKPLRLSRSTVYAVTR